MSVFSPRLSPRTALDDADREARAAERRRLHAAERCRLAKWTSLSMPAKVAPHALLAPSPCLKYITAEEYIAMLRAGETTDADALENLRGRLCRGRNPQNFKMLGYGDTCFVLGGDGLRILRKCIDDHWTQREPGIWNLGKT